MGRVRMGGSEEAGQKRRVRRGGLEGAGEKGRV